MRESSTPWVRASGCCSRGGEHEPERLLRSSAGSSRVCTRTRREAREAGRSRMIRLTWGSPRWNPKRVSTPPTSDASENPPLLEPRAETRGSERGCPGPPGVGMTGRRRLVRLPVPRRCRARCATSSRRSACSTQHVRRTPPGCAGARPRGRARCCGRRRRAHRLRRHARDTGITLGHRHDGADELVAGRVHHFTFAPGGRSRSSVSRPSAPSSEPARIMPCDSTPMSLAGCRLATTTTFFPTRSAGA